MKIDQFVEPILKGESFLIEFLCNKELPPIKRIQDLNNAILESNINSVELELCEAEMNSSNIILNAIKTRMYDVLCIYGCEGYIKRMGSVEQIEYRNKNQPLPSYLNDGIKQFVLDNHSDASGAEFYYRQLEKLQESIYMRIEELKTCAFMHRMFSLYSEKKLLKWFYGDELVLQRFLEEASTKSKRDIVELCASYCKCEKGEKPKMIKPKTGTEYNLATLYDALTEFKSIEKSLFGKRQFRNYEFFFND